MDLNRLLNNQDQSPRRTASIATKQPLGAAGNIVILPPINSANWNAKAVPLKSSTKRKAEEPAEVEDVDIDSDRCQDVDISCDAVRRKVNAFLASGEMKVGEFQKEIGASSKTYHNFMSQNGPHKGPGSSVYFNAFAFCKRRELMGKKIPKKKVKKEEEERKTDTVGVQLDGEAEGEVPIFDSCDEVRKKIRAFLAEPSITQAGFLRAIAQSHPEGKKFQSKSLNDFLGKKGANAGNTSGVFYSAYVFFEKMRIKDGKPKSKHRLEMEKIHSGGGMDIQRPSNRGYWTCMQGETPVMDQYGRVSFRQSR